MVTVFTQHLLAAIPNAGSHMEFAIEPTSWAAGLFDPALEAHDGCVPMTGEPGWGVTIRPEWIAKLRLKPSRARTATGSPGGG